MDYSLKNVTTITLFNNIFCDTIEKQINISGKWRKNCNYLISVVVSANCSEPEEMLIFDDLKYCKQWGSTLHYLRQNVFFASYVWPKSHQISIWKSFIYFPSYSCLLFHENNLIQSNFEVEFWIK